MQKLAKEILKLLSTSTDKSFSRQELEKLLGDVNKRSIQRVLLALKKAQRIETIAQSSATRYIATQIYHGSFEHKLYLYQNQILIGYLGYDFENYYFCYDSLYLLQEKHSTLFEMPLSFVTNVQKSCFVDFEEMLPEGIDREILIEKSGNATEFFLLANNDYANNDFIFSDKKLVFEQSVSSVSYNVQKQKILGENHFPNILKVEVLLDDKSLFPHRYLHTQDIKEVRTISLSGYQHKIQVVLENGTIRIPKNTEDVSYFIKPYHPDKADCHSSYYFPHIALNEHLHLSFAKNELGFDVPMSGLFKRKEDAEYHYIVKYFDRYKGYKFQRKEFSTYLGLNSETKYQSSSEKLFATAAKVLPNEIDRLRMLEYYFYSFVIKHEDMHTKNISTIYDNGKLFIAPLYDIATTAFYDGINNYESHLSINGKQTNIRLKDFLVLVKKANVSRNDFLQKARFILQTYKGEMPKYIKKISEIENCDFYPKNRANLEGKKVKIHEAIDLGESMMHSFEERLKVLENNGWFEQLSEIKN